MVGIGELCMSNNDRILELVKKRLELGQKKYNQDVPINDNRDYQEEALEELLDGVVYLAAQLIRIKEGYSSENLIGKDY